MYVEGENDASFSCLKDPELMTQVFPRTCRGRRDSVMGPPSKEPELAGLNQYGRLHTGVYLWTLNPSS